MAPLALSGRHGGFGAASLGRHRERVDRVAAGSVPGTPAFRDGIGREPVLVTAVDGIPVEGTMRSWCETAGTKRSGEDAELTVRDVRTGRRKTVRLRFA